MSRLHPASLAPPPPHVQKTPSGTRILLAGPPGSGVRLAYQLLRQLQIQSGVGHRSFAQATGMASAAKLLVERNSLAFPGAEELDPLARRGGAWRFVLPEHDMDVDIDLVFERSSLIWALSSPGSILRELPPTHRRIYLVRDGRAAIDSLWRNAMTSAPSNPHRHVYSCLDVFANSVHQWRDSVEAYLEHASQFRELRFERLRADPLREIESLARALDLTVDPLRLAARLQATAPVAAHELASTSPPWLERFRPEHREMFKAIAGETLIRLGYEEGYSW